MHFTQINCIRGCSREPARQGKHRQFPIREQLGKIYRDDHETNKNWFLEDVSLELIISWYYMAQRPQETLEPDGMALRPHGADSSGPRGFWAPCLRQQEHAYTQTHSYLHTSRRASSWESKRE